MGHYYFATCIGKFLLLREMDFLKEGAKERVTGSYVTTHFGR